MAYTNAWSNNIADDTTLGIDLDVKLNRILKDVEERMDHVLGSSAWSSGTDPVINGTTLKSIATIVAEIVTKATLNAGSNNKIVKRVSSGVLGDSLISDDGATVTIPGTLQHSTGPFHSSSQPRFKILGSTTQSFTPLAVSGIRVQFATKLFEVGSCYDDPNHKVLIPAGYGGIWLFGCHVSPVETASHFQYNGSFILRLETNAGDGERLYGGLNFATTVPQDVGAASAVTIANLSAGGEVEVTLQNVHDTNNVQIGQREFWGVKLF